MYFLLQKAISLLNQVSDQFTQEQLKEFIDLKQTIEDYSDLNFDNYNYD